MGPGFRYHVATIVAVFLALGIGMMIGSSNLQQALVEKLQSQLKELTDRFTNEVEPLREENKRLVAAAKLLQEHVTRDALKDTRVAIVVTGDYGDAAQEAAEALRAAGAIIESTTIFPPSFPIRLEMVLPNLDVVKPPQSGQKGDARTAFFARIARHIVQGGPPTEREPLTRAKLIETRGAFAQPVSVVVLVGGGRDLTERRWQTVDYPLLDQLLALGVTVIGVEPRDAVQSYIRAYQAKGISTVDSVDTDFGGTALVLLAAGARGSYGVKGTARDGLLPPASDKT